MASGIPTGTAPTTAAEAASAEEAGILTTTQGSSPTLKETCEAGEWLFQLRACDPTLCAALMDYAVNEVGCKSFTVIHDTETASNDQARLFTEAIEALGGTVDADIPFTNGTKDFTAQISQAMQQLNAHFEDYAKILQENYNGLREDIIWFEQYSDDNGLWKLTDETEEEYNTKTEAYFDHLNEINENRYNEEFARYTQVAGYYTVIKDVDYAGTWGDKLYDFFRDQNETGCGSKVNNFLPLAASLSSGQRAARLQGQQLPSACGVTLLGPARRNAIPEHFHPDQARRKERRRYGSGVSFGFFRIQG